MRCEEVLLTTLPQSEQRAWAQATHFDPWSTGIGSIPMLLKGAIESERHLPAIFRYRLYRAGLCLYHDQASRPIVSVLETFSDRLAWWHWPQSRMTLFAAGWPYQHAWDDPELQDALYRLLGTPVTVQMTIYPSGSAASLVSQVLKQALLAGHSLTAQEFATVYRSEIPVGQEETYPSIHQKSLSQSRYETIP